MYTIYNLVYDFIFTMVFFFGVLLYEVELVYCYHHHNRNWSSISYS